MTATDQGLYDVDAPVGERPGHYIAISGNTAAGKSSLIAALVARLRAAGVDAVGISEREFHHRYLRLMFADSGNFAFPIQLSFMLERHMVLRHNLVRRGRTTVMERSHLDDAMFVAEHVQTGAISTEQADAYHALASTLHAALPVPDVMVLMNPAPELSLERLARAERQGQRPREFPSEAAKRDWVYRWHALYEQLHADFATRARHGDLSGTRLLRLDPGGDPDAGADRVLEALRPLLSPART